MMHTATYTKLKDGSWGVRLSGLMDVLDKGAETTVTVTKKSGEERDENIIVLWSGPDKFNPGFCALCKIGKSTVKSRNGRGRKYDDDCGSGSGFTCANCDGDFPGAGITRSDSSGIQAEVCYRCNRDPDYMLSFG